jgi:hypothetical protein
MLLFEDPVNGLVEFIDKSCGGQGAALAVPVCG